MTKRALVVLLVGINLVLLAILIFGSWQLPEAYAQAAPMGSKYSMVTAEIRDGVDALYVLDLKHRRFHVFIPNRDQNNRKLFHAGVRDLVQDFRGGR